MAKEPVYRPRRKSGRLASAFCTLMGTLIVLLVIASCLPLTAPRLLGLDIYSILSGSMEPEIPTGSLVFSESCPPEEIAPGEIIVFNTEGMPVTHRAVENRVVEGEFVTKGDANLQEDMQTVPYDRLLGRVKYHVPMLGQILVLYGTRTGKIYAFAFLLCGVMFHILASRLRYNHSEEWKRS